MSKIDSILRDQKINRFDGEKGVQNLAILARSLGYMDSQYFGQFSSKGCYGDLIMFLEDNPGAVEAVVDFIRENEDAYEIEADGDEDFDE